MVTDLVVSALLGCLDALFTLLPSFSFPEPETYSGALAWGLGFDGVFPVRTLYLCVVAVLTVEIGLRLWDLGVWVYHQFWGSS